VALDHDVLLCFGFRKQKFVENRCLISVGKIIWLPKKRLGASVEQRLNNCRAGDFISIGRDY
jgi:hypothetical protein